MRAQPDDPSPANEAGTPAELPAGRMAPRRGGGTDRDRPRLAAIPQRRLQGWKGVQAA